MKEVRPGIMMVRRTQKNKFEQLKEDVIRERDRLVNMMTQEKERLAEEVEEQQQASEELKNMANGVATYIQDLREKGLDIDYIKDNAEQIKDIFFAVVEMIKNAEETDDYSTEKEARAKAQANCNGPVIKLYDWN